MVASTLKVTDVAAELGCSTNHVHGLIQSGASPAINVGTRLPSYWRI